jgi:plasmid stabilization system protein ParE
MKVVFVPEARNEFLDAIGTYEEARGGLGERFKEEADRCILWIAEHPEIYRLRSSGYRWINLRAFPYHIPFITRGSTLWVLAVSHNVRKPEYWISRSKGADQ